MPLLPISRVRCPISRPCPWPPCPSSYCPCLLARLISTSHRDCRSIIYQFVLIHILTASVTSCHTCRLQCSVSPLSWHAPATSDISLCKIVILCLHTICGCIIWDFLTFHTLKNKLKYFVKHFQRGLYIPTFVAILPQNRAFPSKEIRDRMESPSPMDDFPKDNCTF